MSIRHTNGPTYRAVTPADFVARWERGCEWAAIKKNMGVKEWADFYQSKGFGRTEVYHCLALAEFLPNDRKQVWNIALLRLPIQAVVKACNEKYTNEMREKWLAKYAPIIDLKKERHLLLSQEQVWTDFLAIVNHLRPDNGHNNGHQPQLMETPEIVLNPGLPTEILERCAETLGNVDFSMSRLKELLESMARLKQELEMLLSEQGKSNGHGHAL